MKVEAVSLGKIVNRFGLRLVLYNQSMIFFNVRKGNSKGKSVLKSKEIYVWCVCIYIITKERWKDNSFFFLCKIKYLQMYVDNGQMKKQNQLTLIVPFVPRLS